MVFNYEVGKRGGERGKRMFNFAREVEVGERDGKRRQCLAEAGIWYVKITKREENKRRWEGGEGLVEIGAKREVSESWGEGWKGVVELGTKGKVCERGWERRKWLVELSAEREESERGRERFNFLVEQRAK